MSDFLLGKLGPNIQPPQLNKSNPASTSASEKGGPAFGDVLKEAIHDVNRLQKQSDEEVRRLMTGEVNDVHTALIAVQKADMSFQMMMQIRNKIVQAYQEIMRMQM